MTVSKLTIFNHKGGVGKTTLTVNIAAALGAMGKRVCLLYTSPSPRDLSTSRMPSSA